MSEVPSETVLEVVVYGNDGGGTDTVSIPLDMYTYFGGGEGPGPVVINPPTSGGGGGDLER